MYAPASNQDHNSNSHHNSNPGRAGRRNGARFLAASLIALGGTAAAATSVSAAPAPPEPGPWEVEGLHSLGPTIPTVQDLIRDDLARVELPGLVLIPEAGEEDADDGAVEGEPCVGICPEEIPRADPEDELTVDYDDDYPHGCDREYPEGEYPEECDDPEETTTTSTTSTTLYDLEEVDVEVEGGVEERTDATLAYTGSNSILPLVGAGLLAVGFLTAGMSMAARRRPGAPGGV